ncbi:hypothetical protein [Solirubrum puertoriconensis]|uniref:Phosphate starvation-inducible protein PsiF n=1 Tax=Solirubrum puertoriconensis TaxID=1751427 RepID=A0A9X0HMQ0_SOLP1|nr:hypothetical protein [Solirubrum puertoriconensis]KUG08857.1 hypothetical protein ASU33_12090 [Solirubrum puertoriconensis]
MKNALLALALFAFVGTASAHDGGKDAKGKKAKKEACSTEMKASCAAKGATASTPSCCMKKGASAATQASGAKPATPAVKSL